VGSTARPLQHLRQLGDVSRDPPSLLLFLFWSWEWLALVRRGLPVTVEKLTQSEIE
jgi:hypothetical protein